MAGDEQADYNGFQFETDLATLAVFDPAAISQRVRSPKDWWRGDPTELSDFDEGRILVLPIGRDGEYRVRLTTQGLREAESPYKRKSIPDLVLDVPSGRVFVGPGERVPGGGLGDRYPRIEGQGELLKVEAGKYHAAVHVFDWRFDRKWFNDDGDPLPEAPADFVIVLTPFAGPADKFFADLPEVLPDLLSLRARPKIEVKPPTTPVLIGARVASKRAATPRSSRRGAVAESVQSSFDDADLLEMIELLGGLETVGGFVTGPILELDDADTIHFQPENKKLNSHSWSVREMLKKSTRVREFLRVLEQKVNTSKALPGHDKAELQEQVTSVYRAIQDLWEFANLEFESAATTDPDAASAVDTDA